MTFLEDDFTVAGTQESAIDNVHLYTGRERDPETGLQLNRHRFYHAQLGRWLTRDPIGYGSRDSNLYGYVGQAPTRFVDPRGLRRRPTRDVKKDFDGCTIYIVAGHYPWVDNVLGALQDSADDYFGQGDNYWQVGPCLGGIACFSDNFEDDIRPPYQIPGFPTQDLELTYPEALPELEEGIDAALNPDTFRLGPRGEPVLDPNGLRPNPCPCEEYKLVIICQPEFASVVQQDQNPDKVPGLRVPRNKLCGNVPVKLEDSEGGRKGQWAYVGEFSISVAK